MEKQFYSFVQKVYEKRLGVEAVAVADTERILLEHHFTPDKARNIYSHTKSYMSTAAGIAISEGKLSLEDKLADFFPGSLPKNPQPELFDITLRHLLTMSSGFHHAYLMNADRRAGVGAPDYMSYMLSRKVEVKPGSAFVYSTADSILAGRMIEKAVGMRLSAYLYEKLFRHLGQGFPMWENDPEGHPIGGGGMFMKLSDMMKLGQLYLANGKWQGSQLVEPAWIREAVSCQIETPNEKKDKWVCGYGYQFWLSPYPGSYRADGAYGQITTVLPQKGLTVAVQCPEEGNFEQVKEALHELMTEL
ncbi:MAG: serine hydrolase [Eubacteriales bacterium]|nr:serine hydrolase [Eubacteriales bacterium]